MPHAQIADIEIKEHTNGYELWMSCLSMGIAVLDVINDNVGIEVKNNPEAAIFLQNYPNPFKYNTSVSFSLPADGFAKLSIYDISGRIVRDLAGGYFTSGVQTIEWNGEDNQGRPVSQGIYVCRLAAGNVIKSIMMIAQ